MGCYFNFCLPAGKLEQLLILDNFPKGEESKQN